MTLSTSMSGEWSRAVMEEKRSMRMSNNKGKCLRKQITWRQYRHGPSVLAQEPFAGNQPTSKWHEVYNAFD